MQMSDGIEYAVTTLCCIFSYSFMVFDYPENTFWIALFSTILWGWILQDKFIKDFCEPVEL